MPKTKTKVCQRCGLHHNLDYAEKNESLIYADWMPGPGLDPRIRKYRCLVCGGDYYRIASEKERAKQHDENI